MSKLRTIAILPTLFTLGNLACGFFAIVVAARVERPTTDKIPEAAAIQSASPMTMLRSLDRTDPVHNCMLSGWLIFLAMVFDALDGHVARLAKSSSDFGAQLDSLCDMITFGVAPAFLLVKICPTYTMGIRAGVDHCRLVCRLRALRLARFNAETHEDDDHLHFSGLPSPAAAAAIASFAIMFYTLRREDNTFRYAEGLDALLQNSLPFFAVLVAVLMVSRIPYPHVVNQVFRGQRSFGHLVALIFAAVVVTLIRGYSVPIICVAFVLWGPVHYAWQEAVERRPHKESMF